MKSIQITKQENSNTYKLSYIEWDEHNSELKEDEHGNVLYREVPDNCQIRIVNAPGWPTFPFTYREFLLDSDYYYNHHSRTFTKDNVSKIWRKIFQITDEDFYNMSILAEITE